MSTIIGSIQIAKKTLTAWNLQAPTLLDGQPAAVTNAGKTFLKIGDGATGWNTLKYLTVENTDAVAEGIANLYFTNARVEMHGDTLYYRKTAVDGMFTTAATNAATLYYQKSVVDGMFADAVKAPLPLDCSANPNYPAATKGTSYKVSIAGKIGGASGETVNVGDLIIASVNTAAGTHAAVGANWGIYETNIDKSSETIFGTARRATTAELTAGTDDVAYVTSAKLRVAADARFLKLSGGTLTGALVGTSASFTGGLSASGAGVAVSLTSTNNSFVASIVNASSSSTAYIGTASNELIVGGASAAITAKFSGTTQTLGGAAGTLRIGTNPTDYARLVYTGGSTTLYNDWASTNAFVDIIANGSGIRVYGNATVFNAANSANFNVTSDKRIKTNIKPLENVIAKLMNLKPSTFDYTPDFAEFKKIEKCTGIFGFIADEYESVYPNLVTTSDVPELHISDLKSIDTSSLLPIVVKAIQEQQAQIHQLKNELKTLKNIN